MAHYIQDIRVLGKDGCWIDGKGFVPLENIFKTDFNNVLDIFIMTVGVIGSIFKYTDMYV